MGLCILVSAGFYWSAKSVDSKNAICLYMTKNNENVPENHLDVQHNELIIV